MYSEIETGEPIASCALLDTPFPGLSNPIYVSLASFGGRKLIVDSVFAKFESTKVIMWCGPDATGASKLSLPFNPFGTPPTDVPSLIKVPTICTAFGFPSVQLSHAPPNNPPTIGAPQQ